MLPTLNLQLLPLESLDDTAAGAAPLPAGADGEVTSGFADLLRFRIDASLLADIPAGEFLPPAGSQLPTPAEFLPTEIGDGGPPTPEPAIHLPLEFLAGTESAAPGELATSVTDTVALHGTPGEVTADDAEMLAVSSSNPAVTAAALRSAIPGHAFAGLANAATSAADNAKGATANADGKPNAGFRPALSDVPVSVRETGRIAPADAFAVTLPGGTGLRELGRLNASQNRSAPITLLDAVDATQDRQSLADFARRMDRAPVPRIEGLGETRDALLPPRAPVSQQGQMTQAQLSTSLSAALPDTPGSQAPVAPATTSSTPPNAAYAPLSAGVSDPIGLSVRDRAWGEQLGERVVMMAGNQLKTVDIRLTPAELGPLRVQVAIDDGAAHVTFHAQHAVTREAIEQALPRLREMLAENGLSLGQTDVSEGGVGEGNKDAATDGGLSKQSADKLHDDGVDEDRQAAGRIATSNGLVDTFA